jgi:hypothetical protein
MSELKEKLEKALEIKANDITSYIWKFSKVRNGSNFTQDEIRLVDSTEEQLREFYAKTQSMLFSRDRKTPGRVLVFKEIQQQQLRCGSELFLRYSESIGSSRIAVLDAIRGSIKNNNLSATELHYILLSDLINVPVEYRNLPIELIMEGCLDRLGRFDRRHITLSFILKQFIWFTKEENKDLTEKDSHGNERDKKDIIKERLNLSPDINLILDPRGLSYTQFRALITLKSKKYSELTSEQLKVLRKRILYTLEDDVKKHIDFWERKTEEIIKVSKSKGIILE